MKRLYLLFALYFFSCTPKSEDSFTYTPLNFPTSKNVEVSKLCNDYLFSATLNMHIVDSVILMRAHSVDNNHQLQVIDIKSKKHIASLGTLGRGAGELNDYSTFAINPKTNEFYAESQNKYVIYDLNKVISGQPNYLKEQGTFKNRNTTHDIYYLTNDEILHLGARPRFIITSKNMQDTLGRYDERHYISNFFAEHEDPDFQRRYMGNNSLFTVKPDKSKFVNSMRNGFYMEIFNIKGNKITPTNECRFFEAKMKDEFVPLEGCIAGPLLLRSTDKYIYVLYSTDLEYAKNMQLGVFDWNGKEVKNYVLDKFAYNFDVTPDDKGCYCWVHEDDDDYLGYFDLK